MKISEIYFKIVSIYNFINYSSDEDNVEEEEDHEDEDGEDGVGEEDLAMFMKQLEKQGTSGFGTQGCMCCGAPPQLMQLRKFAVDEDEEDSDSDEDSDVEYIQYGNSDYGV